MRNIKPLSAASSLLILAACAEPFAEARDAVAYQAKDPESVKFRNVSECPNAPGMVQGEFNGKNGFGAYSGFQQFIYASGSLAIEEEGDLFIAMSLRCFGADAFEQSSPAKK